MSYRVLAHSKNGEVAYRGREVHASYGAAEREAKVVARRAGLTDVHIVKDGKRIVGEVKGARSNPASVPSELCREKCRELGLSFRVTHRPDSQGGQQVYVISGQPMTPGEALRHLGLKWSLRKNPDPHRLDKYCPCGECGLDKSRWSPQCRREAGLSSARTGFVLKWLVANNAYAFTLGDSLQRIHQHAPMFFQRRGDAVYEARMAGLSIGRNGVCKRT